jgi:DNA-binding NtrC family response regulator
LITGHCGPKAFETLKAAGIEIVSGDEGCTVSQALEKYKSGAFTGANRNKPGRFALAKGGTIFLDGIAELVPSLQIKLLRVFAGAHLRTIGSRSL